MPPAADNATCGAPAVRCCGNPPKRAGRAGMGGRGRRRTGRIAFSPPRARPAPSRGTGQDSTTQAAGLPLPGLAALGGQTSAAGPASREVARWFRGYRRHRPHACHFEPQRTRLGSRRKKRCWAEKIPHRLEGGCAAALPAIRHNRWCHGVALGPRIPNRWCLLTQFSKHVLCSCRCWLLARLPNDPSPQKRHTPNQERRGRRPRLRPGDIRRPHRDSLGPACATLHAQ